MKSYVLFYGDKKLEDNICVLNMVENTHKINLGWTDIDYKNNIKIIEKCIDNKCNQIIFLGLEIGWDKMISDLKKNHKELKIKVICNTQDSLLYYEYERENFFRLLELSSKGIIDDIAFLRRSQYETYKGLGYECSWLMENYNLKNQELNKIVENTKQEGTQVGIYPLNYTWDKNIFNQLCITKFIENSNLNYNYLDPRMKEFLETMGIKSTPEKIEKIDEENIIKSIKKNDVIVSTSFTEYMHPIFWISMELGIPCLIGNNTDFFENEKYKELKEYIVTTSEDNPIINAKKVELIIQNKDRIIELYKQWKNEYNKIAEESKIKFINK